MRLTVIATTVIVSCILVSPALAWNDATHMAVMKAAGLGDYAYLAAGPDMSKLKAGGHEEGNHYCNNKRGTAVTTDMVLDQVRDYDCRCFGKGHLYGAIVAAAHQYFDNKKEGKYWRYELAFLAHYIADLSMPLHNVDYDQFNKVHHSANDGAVEPRGHEPNDVRVAGIAAKIEQRMKALPLYLLPAAKNDVAAFDLRLAAKIAEIANNAISIGYSLQDSAPPRPVMSTDEAYGQLAQSAALLKAVYAAMQ